MSDSRIDVVLVATGEPRDTAHVAEFLHCSTGVKPDAGAVRAATERYAGVADGAVSAGTITRLAAALQVRLAADLRVPVRVRAGYLCGAPTVAATLAKLDADMVVAVSLAPFAPRRIMSAMQEAIRAAEAPHNGGRGRDIPLLDDFYTERPFAQAVSRRIAEALDGSYAPEWAVLFVSRSLLIKGDDDTDPAAYKLDWAVDQILPAVVPGTWGIAYAGGSRDRADDEARPDAAAREVAGDSWVKLLVVPIGYIGEDADMRYDLDVVLRAKAREIGLTYRRAKPVGDSPAFVAALAGAVMDAVALESATPAPVRPQIQKGASPAADA
jgi:protoheme ferro-lyase